MLPHVTAEVVRLREEGHGQQEIADILSISRHAVRRALDPEYDRKWPSYHGSNEPKSQAGTPIASQSFLGSTSEASKKQHVTITDMQDNLVEPVNDVPSSWQEWMAHLKQVQSFRKIDPLSVQDDLKINFNEGLPIGISIFSDTHLGDSGLAYDLLDKHVQLVKDTDGMYSVFNGDELNNFLGSLSHAGRSDLIQNEQQWQAVEALFDELEGTILTVTRGNHNDWTSRHAGVDLQARILRRFNLVDIGQGAKLHITVGDHTYVLMLRHKYRYNSAQNPGHSVMKMYDEHGPFDIGCIGHTHEAGVGYQIKQGRRVGWMRPGSYKLLDSYADECGFPRALPLSPTMILFPNEKKFELYDNVKDAADRLEFLRNLHRGLYQK